ncbi:zincin-like metallopeptidase domain-containing protein [Pseudomonas sp. MIL19]|uniref:zincin-like metallopeptidase domain-containing protein n=1 Tax=Pseudomonas sp. MIL19 TaxID=2976979 RepID=UPI0023633EB7|nr:zincin-like metallopeptidase domain-containing protein [Pseudomonas sp. MIL19]MDD2162232.1 zincin-like metallopeptidase domain-containing protein [Pseudomonas sp. MIL19]
MPMTKAEAQGVTRLFVRDYPGALELAYRFREDTAGLYGDRAAEVPGGMKGGYIPKPTEHNGRTYRGRIDVPLENMTDARDLLLTLRHEVLGHYGANTFAPAEKRALLDGLAASREEPSLKPLWDDVDRRYADSSQDVRAEEVFALYCEGVAPNQHAGIDQVQQRGQQSFAETCIARARPMQASDLQNIVCMVAQGIQERSRTQQTFPHLNELFRKGETMEPKKPFHEIVAEKLIEQLKAGTAPWQKPWMPGEFGSMPMNPTTGNRYKGVNSIQLMMQGCSDPRWMTYNQALDQGAQVRKGEKSTMIQYWKFSEERIKKENGKPVLDEKGNKVKETVQLERPKCFHAYVFNAEQIDGLPAITRKEQTWDAVERAEHILQASGARITHAAGDRAFYRPSTDSITMPERGQFALADNYYATALHELGHWTGHPSRLDRDLSNPFGSEGYAKEELRAEISSMILGNELGIGHDPGQHVAYVGSWIKVLQEDPLEIFRAAADAEKIQAFVLAFEQKQVQDHQVDAEQLGQEQAEVLAHIQATHKNANPGYSALESWQTLERAAEANGLKAMLRWSNAGEYEADIRVEYQDADGKLIPVHSELHSGDGKAVSCIEGQRVPGTGMTSDAEWQTDALNSAIATDQHRQQQKQEQQQATSPAARYEEMLTKGGRLVDRLVESRLMTPADAALTDARRDLLSMSVAPEADQAVFRQASEKALGVELPPEWDGRVELSAVRDDDALPNQYVVSVGAGDQSRQVAVLSTSDEAIALADRLLMIETYSQHAASNLQDLKAVQDKLENHRSDARLQLHGSQQQEATLEQGQQLPQQEITQQQLTAEQWVLDKLSSDLRPAIGRMNERQLDTVQGVLGSMHPMGNHNPFWQRHEQAAEAMYQDVDQVEKQIFDATDAVSERREVLQGQGLVQADDMQQAVEQARLREEQVRQNPNSTDEDISAAKEERKNAEVALALNDPEMQRRIAELEKSEARSEQSSTNVAKEKTWLAVPYEQRDEAKKVAGKLQNGRSAIGFDKPTKCWYAQPGADLDKLQKWLPENQVRQAPAMEPREEFAQVMKEAGLVVDGEHPIMDGKWHRVSVEGGSKGNTSGAYRGFELAPGEKGVPAGTIQNHRTGFQSNWKAKGYALSEGDKASFNAEAAQRQAQREQERLANQVRAVKAIGELLAIAPQATADHTYLKNKEARPGDLKVVPTDTTGLPADSIILIGKNARESKALREANPDNLVFTAGDLLLTAQDSNGDLKAAQLIRANGTKMFAKGTEKHQNFHVVGGAGLEALQEAPAIVIGEGYATADTLSQSLGYATVAAFDSGNLPHVAKQMREQFPDKPILIAGDNDLHQELIDGKNPGRTKAQEAAKAVEGKAIFPIFAPGEQAYPAGVEPIGQEKARANKLTPEQQEAINQMKRFTDFNDLATKSSLGREALDRQVRSEVGLAIEKHQERIEQKRLEQVQAQTQTEKQQPRRAMSR